MKVLFLFNTFFLSLCFIFQTPLFAQENNINESSTLSSNGVTIAYRLDSAPMQFQNKEGNADGLLIDLWRLWSIKSGIPVHFIGAYNKEAQKMVIDGRADINAGLFESKKRSEFLDFSDPLMASPYYIFYQSSINLIHSIDYFKTHSLGVTRGSFHENYLREHYPGIELILFDGYQEIFTAAEKGEIQGFVTQPHYLNFHLNSALKNEKASEATYERLEPPLYTRAYKASVQKGNQSLLAIINQNLSLLTREDRRVITQYWLSKSSGKFELNNLFSTKMLELTNEEKQWLKQHPIIDIGVDGNWPPVDFMDKEGQHSGIVHDFIENIEHQLGIQFNIVPGPTFNKMLDRVKKGELKLATTIVKTDERSEKLWFTAPYFTAYKIILSRKGATSYHTPEELSGKVVVMEEGYFTIKIIEKLYPEIKLKLVPSTLDALNEVSWGKADAYIGNAAVVQWLMQEHQIVNLEVTGDSKLQPSAQRFAVNKEQQWKPLVGILNKALGMISVEQRNKIYQNWLGLSELSQNISRRLNLTASESDWLEQHPKIRLGIDVSWPPIEFIDDNGIYQGLSAEFVKVMSRSLHLDMMPIKNLSWEQVIEKAKNKQLDMIPALMQSKDREHYLNFTQSYLNFPFVIFVRDRQTYTIELSDLNGKTVAVEKAYVTQEYLQRDYPEINLVEVKNTREGLEKVSLGQADAYVGNLTVGSYLITQYGITNIKVGGTTPYTYDLRMGVRKDWPELVSIFNKFLNTLSVGEKSQIRQKWLSVKYDVNVDNLIIKQVITGASILLLFSLIWIIYIRRKQKQLSRSEEQLSKIINTIPVAIVLSDKNGVIIKANPHVSEVLQSSGHTVIGRNMGELYDDIKEREFVLKNLKEKGGVKDIQVHFRTDTGGIVTGLISATPIHFGKQVLNLGIFVNLTERIKMEKALKKAKEASEQSSQFKSDFLANMSHEIRTPMNAIIGMSHLVLQTDLNDKQFDYINKVQISAHNLLGIINDILDFSKIEAGKLNIEKTEFYLDEVLETLADMVNLKAEEKGIEILFRRDVLIPGVLIGDPLRLGQVLVNLVQNAIKFTDNGEVVISVGLAHAKENNLELYFSVCDSGIGIDPERVEHLFDPFVQADSSISRKHGGTGLGLSISRQIVELMGGTLKVISEPGRGSTFSFKINFEKQQGASQRLYNLEPDLRKMRVLLVDDNPVAQKIMLEMLESFSFQVDVASCAKEAYELLLERGGESVNNFEPIDLVLMDWRMPEINGLDAAEFIQTQMTLKKIPKIILITAYGREEIIQQAEKTELDGFIIKPITPSTLFDTIMSVFNKEKIRQQRRQTNIFSRRLKGTVLLVEDNSINQQVAQEILEGFGLLVIIANDGHEAVEQVHQTNFDVVLMDIQMPGMDGLEATQIIRSEEQFADLPIVAMTAHAMEGDKELCLNKGMNDYLSKPIDPEKLLQTLMKWLGEGVVNENYSLKRSQETAIHLPESLPGIDLSWGLKRVGGNKTLFTKLLNDFNRNHSDCCQQLEQMLNEKNIGDARRLVHTIHGVSGNIGARDLQKTAQIIEVSMRENKNHNGQWLLLTKKFCEQAQIVFNGLNTIIEQEGDVTPQKETYVSLDTSEIKLSGLSDLVKKFEKLLSEGDSKALETMDSFKNMINSSGQKFDKQLFIQFEQQINDYEYDEALETLRQLTPLLFLKN